MELDRSRQQGWESLPGTTMWSRDNFGSKILSQGRELNEKVSQESQMFLSTCFGAEIIYILELMEHFTAWWNLGSWVNVWSRMLGKLHTPNPFSLPHLFRSLGKTYKHKSNAWLHISFSSWVSIFPWLGNLHLKGVLLRKEREVLFHCDFWYSEPLPVFFRLWRLTSRHSQSNKGTH